MREKMTRRERILTALNKGVPDRPPISFDVTPGIKLSNVEAVYRHYGVNDKNGLYAAADIDGFSVWEWNAVMGKYVGPPKVASDGSECDFWGNAYPGHFGLYECDTVADLDAHRWPLVGDFDFSHIKRDAQEIREKDMVVAAGHIGLGYQMHNMLRGNEKALFDVCDESFTHCLAEHLLEFTSGYLHTLLQAGDGLIDVVRADDDMGTMDRLMISPQMWRKFYKPVWKKAFEIVHSYGAKVWFHSCGYVMPLMDDLIEAGIDCWNPLPGYVKDNDHATLKVFRKDRIALDGGVSHKVLVSGSPKQVKDETRRVLDIFGPDGGFIVGPSQVLTEDIPVDNIISMFETALNYKI
jgi:uroporphyrinogen decarboxylase